VDVQFPALEQSKTHTNRKQLKKLSDERTTNADFSEITENSAGFSGGADFRVRGF
jgi:hypothetical protein